MANANNAIRWWDDHYQSVDRVVLTARDLDIPGIRVYGWHDMKRAFPALDPHFHEDSFEIVFATKGSISFYADQREYTINGGDAFLTFPNEIHSTNSVPMSIGEICWIQLDVSHPSEFLFLNETAAKELIEKMHRIRHHRILGCSNMCKNVAVALKEAILNTEKRDPYLIASFVVTFLYQLLMCTENHGPRITLDIARACEYINDHICEELPLEEIADFCHMSVSHFKQKFKTQLGVSPRSYINKQKITQIKKELTKGSNLTLIANKYCFCNSSYFSTVFKKYTNQTPTEYIYLRSDR